MFKILMTLALILTTGIPLMKTPLSMGMLVLLQTITICSLTRMISMSSWLPFTMFLIMVSGLMVIFLYITSICSNKKFSFLKVKLILLLPILLMGMWLKNMFSFSLSFKDTLQIKDFFNHEFIKVYIHMNIFSSMFMFVYLLVALIIMINLLLLNKGPMRKKY